MNEKMQYESMLEMPLSTATVTIKPSKKKRRSRKVDCETVKQELIDKVNADQVEEEQYNQEELYKGILFPEQEKEETLPSQDNALQLSGTNTVTVMRKKKEKKKFKLSIIAVQFALIGALIATIFLSSAINTNSGINVFFRNVFGNGQTVEYDQREYTDFAPVLSVTEADFSLENGVMTLYNEGSVYSSCDGKISALNVDQNGKYTVEIEHSVNFKTVLGGLDFVYGDVGSKVYSKVPVGYADVEGATMCFTGADGSVISNYQIVDNSVVWAV